MTAFVVRNEGELIAEDGNEVVARGTYRSTTAAIRGAARSLRPKNRAVLILDDGIAVWLEVADSRASRRSARERCRLDGHRIELRGIAHQYMPTKGEGLLAPCITDITHLVRLS